MVQKKKDSVDLINDSLGNVCVKYPIQVVVESKRKGGYMAGGKEPFGLA